MPFAARQRGQVVRDQTDPDAEREACDNIYKPKVRRQPGREAAAKVSVAPEPQAGVRSQPRRSQDGPGAVQEGAEPAGPGVRRRWHRRMGAVDPGPNIQRFVVPGGCAPVGHGQRLGQSSRLGRRKYNYFIKIFSEHFEMCKCLLEMSEYCYENKCFIFNPLII